ncbi:MAG: D-aminoacyl-tRNA deacylase [Candidatus Latescibacterota bacterium]|jgi:D-aminoacyl-tRNA deacylase
MRVLVQRVSQARVSVDGQTVGQIAHGLLLLLGFRSGDDQQALRYCAQKCAHLRVFTDDEGKMNRSLLDIGGSVLCISQFTLYGDCRKGRRPSFDAAACPAEAEVLYESFLEILAAEGLQPARGVFGAHMQVEIHNDGPVTLMVESPQ